jgi:DNA-3-methyladenine glycosylase II
VDVEVRGPWSLATSKSFWEGFAPAALESRDDQGGPQRLRSVFRVDGDWSRAEIEVTQQDSTARVEVTGDGDLEAAVAQVCRFLSLDVDARGWPDIGLRDPVIADVQAQLPGLRPCGFHSPYEAAAWSVLSQRIRIVQAARLRDDLVSRHGDDGAFPAPHALRDLDLDLPGRKAEYLSVPTPSRPGVRDRSQASDATAGRLQDRGWRTTGVDDRGWTRRRRTSPRAPRGTSRRVDGGQRPLRQYAAAAGRRGGRRGQRP